jgi:hypothetical protein
MFFHCKMLQIRQPIIRWRERHSPQNDRYFKDFYAAAPVATGLIAPERWHAARAGRDQQGALPRSRAPVPAILETGYPGFDAIGWHGILARANTPPAIVNKFNAEIVEALKQPQTRALMESRRCRPSATRRRPS